MPGSFLFMCCTGKNNLPKQKNNMRAKRTETTCHELSNSKERRSRPAEKSSNGKCPSDDVSFPIRSYSSSPSRNAPQIKFARSANLNIYKHVENDGEEYYSCSET